MQSIIKLKYVYFYMEMLRRIFNEVITLSSFFKEYNMISTE